MAATSTIKTVLLNAFPAGGKSEIRKFFKFLGAEKCVTNFRLGEFVQLDDYPYVDIMRRVDEALNRLGQQRMFFDLPDRGFITDHDWGTLTHLVNEDYEDLVNKPPKPTVASAARWMFERYDQARAKVGITRFFGDLSAKTAWALADLLEERCRSFLDAKWKDIPDTLEGKTVIIEFSRGGAHGITFPIKEPNGYQYTYSQLSPRILENAAILYVSVTAEMSRAKNKQRGAEAPGNVAASVGAQIMHSLNHSVPDHVMWNAYGCDDIEYLVRTSDIPSTVMVQTHGRKFYLPIAFFNNHEDLTTFCRGNAELWPEDAKARLNQELTRSFSGLLQQYQKLHGL
ncbi:hypothetical protein Pelo_5857 [Pelomyxa schiedti]|nr:hypothetical protein Pelo_5857 [Pelomyxa schiedti]